MKKKSYKLVKGVIALSMVGIIATSFSACKTTGFKNSENVNSDDKIELVDENNNKLIVLAQKPNGNSDYDEEEKYGYIRVNDGKTEFYNVLEKKTIDLDVWSERFLFRYCDFTELLLDRDYPIVIENGYIDSSNLKSIKRSAWVTNNGEISEANYILENNNRSAILKDLELGVAYTDDSLEKEETTLSMNK